MYSRRALAVFFALFLSPLLFVLSKSFGQTENFSGTIRDFSMTNPAFEQYNLNDLSSLPTQFLPDVLGGQDQYNNVEPGIVQNTLGADGTPVYQGGTNPALYQTVASATLFNQWFHDTPGVNESEPFSIALSQLPDSTTYEYAAPAVPDSGQGFFPIDNQLLGNEGQAHNYDFTVQLDTTFTYEPGQSFTFIGNDDAFVFINGQLAIDDGGIHAPIAGTADLDTLGLTAGDTYDLDLFYADRNQPDGNFRIDTNIVFNSANPSAVPLPKAFFPTVSMLVVLAGFGWAQNRSRRRAATA